MDRQKNTPLLVLVCAWAILLAVLVSGDAILFVGASIGKDEVSEGPSPTTNPKQRKHDSAVSSSSFSSSWNYVFPRVKEAIASATRPMIITSSNAPAPEQAQEKVPPPAEISSWTTSGISVSSSAPFLLESPDIMMCMGPPPNPSPNQSTKWGIPKTTHHHHHDGSRSSNAVGDDDTWLEDVDIQGARLLSSSFRILSWTLRGVSDGMRITGDTTAGLIGSSTKLLGSGVKALSGTIHSTGRILEPKPTKVSMRDNIDSDMDPSTMSPSQPLVQPQSQQCNDNTDNDAHNHPRTPSVVRNTRHVAAKSVRLVATVVEELGETLLLAGTAAESITSSTVGVAADVVHLAEGLASTMHHKLSKTLPSTQEWRDEKQTRTTQPEEEKRRSRADTNDGSSRRSLSAPSVDSPWDAANLKEPVIKPPFLSFGVRERKISINKVDDGMMNGNDDNYARSHPSAWGSLNNNNCYSVFGLDLSKLMDITVYDTSEGPSELLVILIICYLASAYILGRLKRSPPRNLHLPALECGNGEQHDEAQEHQGLKSAQKQQPIPPSKKKTRRTTICLIPSIMSIMMLRLIMLPFRVTQTVWKWFLSLLSDNRIKLLGVYGLAWVYLCQSSRIREQGIQQVAEAVGFRSAMLSQGSTPAPAFGESMIWLNSLVESIWRVPFFDESSSVSRAEDTGYPPFVVRAMRSTLEERPLCRAAVAASDSDGDVPHYCLPYGGLEPFLASGIGKMLLKGLEAAKATRPQDVAFVSLHSLTLGSRPPLVRSVKLLGAGPSTSLVQSSGNGGRKELNYEVDVDALLDDLSLVLEVKLSPLRYSLLPSTKVAIHDVNIRLPLMISLVLSPQHPFVSSVEISMREVPQCNVRITTMGDDSGLHGLDLGSLPMTRMWIQDALRTALSGYVAPKYVALNVAEMLAASKQAQLDAVLAQFQTKPDIQQLRRKTKEQIEPTPRTSVSEGIAITSVADKLPSRVSANQAPGVPQQTTAAPDKRTRDLTRLRPTTELSRMAMERWVASSAQKMDGLKRGDPASDSKTSFGQVGLRVLGIFPAAAAVIGGFFFPSALEHKQGSALR